MKKLGLVVIVLVMLVAIVGCELGDTPEKDEQVNGDVPADTEPGSDVQMVLYVNHSMGFTVRYPYEWIWNESNGVVTFSGPEGTDEYFTTVTIQNLRKGDDDDYPDIQSVFEGMKGQLDGAGGSVHSVEEDAFNISGVECTTIHYESSYVMDTENMRQIATIIEREDKDVFHTMTYNAPEELFDLSFNIATIIIDSLELE